MFFDFCKSFLRKFVPKFTIRESFCQKFRNFLISQKFLLAKVSAPKVSSSVYPDRQFDGVSFSNFIFYPILNSIRNKLEPPKKMIKDNTDILLVSETKLHDAFPVGQLCIDGYSTPYRFDRTSHGGGLLLYIREDISS